MRISTLGFGAALKTVQQALCSIPKVSDQECCHYSKECDNGDIGEPKQFGRRLMSRLGEVRKVSLDEFFSRPGTGGGCDATDGKA